MRCLYYITHPQVVVDLERPVTSWRLSEQGRARARRMLRQPWIGKIGRIVCSAEDKARQTAELLGAALAVAVEVRDGLGENDRSATGPLPPDEFERMANRFFAEPERSVRGWERAVDAQARVAHGLADLLSSPTPHDIAVVGHGGVGTLWYCHLLGLPIERRHDQPGQGHYFSVDLATGKPLHGYRPIDP